MMRAAMLALAAVALIAADGPAVPPDQASEHVVKPGETLGGIAQRAKVPRVLIAEANGLRPPYAVKAGQRLLIPRTRHHTVQAGENGFGIAYAYGVPFSAIAVANGLPPDAKVKAGQRLLIPTILNPPPAAPAQTAAPVPRAPDLAWPLKGPLKGEVRRGFTARPASGYHDGLDIKVPSGTAVRASAAGKVIFAGEEAARFGNLVVIDHGQGWHTAYAFLSRVTVKKGAPVRKGERIGLSGRTGMARGEELHFEVRQGNRPVDPARLLPRASGQ